MSNEGTSRSRSRVGVRVVFAAVIVFFPVQMAIAFLVDEPYPALFQPSFAGTPLKNDELTRVEPTVELRFVGGDTASVPWEEVLPQTRLHSLAVFTAAFRDDSRADLPETKAWLTASLDERYGRGAVDEMTVSWSENVYSPWTGDVLRSTPVSEVNVKGLSQ